MFTILKLNIQFFPHLNWIWMNKTIKKSIWIEFNIGEYSNSFELLKKKSHSSQSPKCYTWTICIFVTGNAGPTDLFSTMKTACESVFF